ncbi:extracellular solute-binding protein [Bradyrhizobium sp. 33ap4]|uniref:extracellular solute-binding protein n=1 Tax=Bradyrhizobium sp. 33ap4 TaxID=3061630 RepID=UPI003977DE49
MTSAPNARIYDAIKNAGKLFEVMWDAQAQEPSVWVIPKGTPRLDAAYRFLAYATSATAAAWPHTVPSVRANQQRRNGACRSGHETPPADRTRAHDQCLGERSRILG